MEEPGSRPTQPRELIIDSPDALRLRDRWAEVSITLFFWLLMLYLWQPLLSALAWYFQSYVLYRHMIELGGYKAFSESALDYILFILLLDCIFLIWARINLWRFRDKERRGPVPDTSLLEHCLYFNVAARDVETWRSYKQMVVSFDEEGGITSATPSSLAAYPDLTGK